MTTPARWRALAWFRDHQRDINSVMGRKQPTARMRNTMIRVGQLQRVKVGSFSHVKFELTESGRALIDSKYKRKSGGRKRDGPTSAAAETCV